MARGQTGCLWMRELIQGWSWNRSQVPKPLAGMPRGCSKTRARTSQRRATPSLSLAPAALCWPAGTRQAAHPPEPLPESAVGKTIILQYTRGSQVRLGQTQARARLVPSGGPGETHPLPFPASRGAASWAHSPRSFLTVSSAGSSHLLDSHLLPPSVWSS